MNIVSSIVKPILDFIYPPVCFTCDQYLSNQELKICNVCWNSFTILNSGDPQYLEIKSKFGKENKVEDFLSCYLFEKEGKLQEVIHLLKYRGIKSLGIKLGEEIGKRILRNEKFLTADLLIPVPLHKIKKRERGYNQSEYICKGISNMTNIKVDTTVIRRVKYTQSQTKLNINERKDNVADAFQVDKKNKNLVEGKSIIIVDDVITTGSTIDSCATEILNANAKSVLAASVAIAQ